MLAQSITTALKGRWYGAYGFVRCVAHQDGRPSLRLRDGDKGLLVHCYAGCDAQIILGNLRAQKLVGGTEPSPEILEAARARQNAVEAKRTQSRISSAYKIWCASSAPQSTPAEAYLRRRGITLAVPPSIRCHHSLTNSDTHRFYPALVGAVQRPDRRITAVHRIYLTPDGHKADVPTVKSSFGPTSGGAVRLAPAAALMAVGEGIETCLSYMQMTGVPTWAALTTSGIRSVVIPDVVKQLHILVDRDEHGASEKAAAALTARYPGIECSLHMARVGKDFNDELNGGGK